MIRRTIRTVISAAIGCSSFAAVGQNRPAFCDPVPDALLGGLQAPYARQIAPDGNIYCEGLLRKPIALELPTVISLKQDQTGNYTFVPGKIASITWCDDSRELVHVRLRSMKPPLFALDAMHADKFEWRTDLIAIWQPDWKSLAAVAIRDAVVGGQTYKVLLPLRNGTGYSSSYSFIVQSKRPVHLTTALIEPSQPSNRPMVVDLSFSIGPSKDTLTATIPFQGMQNGIYRVTFEEGIEQAGVATEPIYLLHRACIAR